LGRHSAAAPSRFHSLLKHVAINEGVATEGHPYKRPPPPGSTHFRNMSQSTKGWPRRATPTSGRPSYRYKKSDNTLRSASHPPPLTVATRISNMNMP
jgi:hypothetical protein